MAWSWTSNFPSTQDIWIADDNGFGPLAIYTTSVGWLKLDAQTSPAGFSRLVDIKCSFSSIVISSIEINYDYVRGAFSSDLSAIAIFTGSGSNIILSSATTDGTGQTFVFNPGVNETDIEVLVRSSLQGSATFNGTAILNSITITGPGNISPFQVSTFQTPSQFIDDQGGGGGFDGIADISADGLFIYIALFTNLGSPMLVKFSTAIDANGSEVFSPGAGGRIGVQCGVLGADVVWVAGEFDGTNVIEKSENAGTTFIVKDNGTIGVIRAFKVGPWDDNRVLIVDNDNGDILETIDDGATWTTINSSVTPLINAISRLSKNLEEVVFVNQGGGTDSIDYSVNSGANLEDFQTGVYPNANGTGVVVS